MNSFITIIIISIFNSGKSLSISTQNIIKMYDRNIVRLNCYYCWRMCGANFYWCTRNNCVRCVCSCVFAMWITAGVDKWCSAIIYYPASCNEKCHYKWIFGELFRRTISRRTRPRIQTHGLSVHHTLLWIMYGSSMVHVEFIVSFHFIWGMNWMNINKPIHQLCVCSVSKWRRVRKCVRVHAFAHHPLTPNKITVYDVCQ